MPSFHPYFNRLIRYRDSKNLVGNSKFSIFTKLFGKKSQNDVQVLTEQKVFKEKIDETKHDIDRLIDDAFGKKIGIGGYFLKSTIKLFSKFALKHVVKQFESFGKLSGEILTLIKDNKTVNDIIGDNPEILSINLIENQLNFHKNSNTLPIELMVAGSRGSGRIQVITEKDMVTIIDARFVTENHTYDLKDSSKAEYISESSRITTIIDVDSKERK
jgi:hypothetical protein